MDITQIKQEQVNFLRNNDILTITQRDVTTATLVNQTLSSASTWTISKTDIKNIRHLDVDEVTLVYGKDYTVDFKHANGCVITFTEEQTGSMDLIYDYGGDKIFPDFPRNDLTIGSYPRIAIDIINAPIEPLGIGGDSFISNVSLTIVVFANKSGDLDSYIQTIKDLYVSNSKNFYYLNFIKPTLIGPTINSPDKKDVIMQKNIDIMGMFSVDTA